MFVNVTFSLKKIIAYNPCRTVLYLSVVWLEGWKGVAQAEGHANRQLQYFGTTRPPKRRPPYPPRPSTKMKKQVSVNIKSVILYYGERLSFVNWNLCEWKATLIVCFQVSWFEGSRTFALRASVDARLLIRHSPVPEQGSPWPLPQHYFPEPTVFTLNSKSFRFYAAGESCDILTFAFKRIYRNIFGAGETSVEFEALGLFKDTQYVSHKSWMLFARSSSIIKLIMPHMGYFTASSRQLVPPNSPHIRWLMCNTLRGPNVH